MRCAKYETGSNGSTGVLPTAGSVTSFAPDDGAAGTKRDGGAYDEGGGGTIAALPHFTFGRSRMIAGSVFTTRLSSFTRPMRPMDAARSAFAGAQSMS